MAARRPGHVAWADLGGAGGGAGLSPRLLCGGRIPPRHGAGAPSARCRCGGGAGLPPDGRRQRRALNARGRFPNALIDTTALPPP